MKKAPARMLADLTMVADYLKAVEEKSDRARMCLMRALRVCYRNLRVLTFDSNTVHAYWNLVSVIESGLAQDSKDAVYDYAKMALGKVNSLIESENEDNGQ